MYRIEIGRQVRERLLANKAVRQLPAQGLDMFLVPAFLDEQECGGLIALIDADRRPSRFISNSADPDPEFRTSETCDLQPSDPLVRRVDLKISTFLGIDPTHGELIQGQRYGPGQQFKQHFDFFDTDQPYWERQKAIGGQRTWTAMVFLNEPAKGGETFFEDAGVKVSPRTGDLLAWNNMDAGGEPNDFAIHQGCRVEAGEKYIITKFFRERPFGKAARRRSLRGRLSSAVRRVRRLAGAPA